MAVVRLAGMVENELSVFLKIADGRVGLSKYGFHVHERSCSKIVDRESYAPGADAAFPSLSEARIVLGEGSLTNSTILVRS